MALLAYFGIRHLMDPDFRAIYAAANLVVHEAGHAFFSWFGSQFLSVAGGTLFEVLVPVLVGVYFVRRRDPFAVTVTGFWTATALLSVAVYMGDAQSRALPLVTLGEGSALHDWHYLLGRMGIVEYDGPLSRLVRRGGLLLLFASVAAGGWVANRIRLKRPGDPYRLESGGESAPLSRN